jgi:hypothetical protein
MVLLEVTKKDGIFEVAEFQDDALKVRPEAFIKTVKMIKSLPDLRYAAAFDKDRMRLLEGLHIRRL